MEQCSALNSPAVSLRVHTVQIDFPFNSAFSTLTSALPLAADAAPSPRLQQIARARQVVLREGASAPALLPEDWIERSWRRCLAQGQRPEQEVAFELLAPQSRRRTEEANHWLVQAARPVLEQLGQAIASTRYFAILTNAQGVVVDVNGPIDRRDRRADLISRVGVDLSEASVGTTAIGAALTEQRPVWLHRGEHFFDATSAYSCAGAPVFGPDGLCAGMLDLTGVDTPERPELRHLVVQSARSIENALMQNRPHALLLRINWPGAHLGEDGDGLVCLDADGWITGANPAARQMVTALSTRPTAAASLHASELFALPHERLFEAARKAASSRSHALPVLDVPLWSGLRLAAMALPQGNSWPPHASPAVPERPLKDLETALIRQAVAQARGNVMQAARALGISRATVYRRLGKKP
jgi:transcriptional regulator of acetoin/glycerol metabolism